MFLIYTIKLAKHFCFIFRKIYTVFLYSWSDQWPNHFICNYRTALFALPFKIPPFPVPHESGLSEQVWDLFFSLPWQWTVSCASRNPNMPLVPSSGWCCYLNLEAGSQGCMGTPHSNKNGVMDTFNMLTNILKYVLKHSVHWPVCMSWCSIHCHNMLDLLFPLSMHFFQCVPTPFSFIISSSFLLHSLMLVMCCLEEAHER